MLYQFEAIVKGRIKKEQCRSVTIAKTKRLGGAFPFSYISVYKSLGGIITKSIFEGWGGGVLTKTLRAVLRVLDDQNRLWPPTQPRKASTGAGDRDV